jgi:deoxyribonuclease V
MSAGRQEYPVVPFEAPLNPDDAMGIQHRLRRRLVLPATRIALPRFVAGLDVAYDSGSSRAVAAAVVVDVEGLGVQEVAVARGTVTYPYVPGLLAFRELPLLLDALSKLTRLPELLVCDGYGLAHPRRFGLACHLGVLVDVPTFGVAKTSFTATFTDPGRRRGEWSELVDGTDVLGRAVRTQTDVKPVFVSVGNRIGLADAADLTVKLSGRYRVPEPTRQADIVSRQVMRQYTHEPTD